jgi:hypothetical protein
MGSPLVEGWFVTGDFGEHGPSGHAHLSIPISGPRGKGTIYVVGSKSTGEWQFSTLLVQPDGTRERIDLQDHNVDATSSPNHQ